MIKKEVNYNQLIIIGSVSLSVLIYFFSSFGIFISLGVGYFVAMFLRMINEMGTGLPMRELMSVLLLIQVFISPLFAYRFFNNEAHFIMHIHEEAYMSFALPASILFTIGLFISLPGEKVSSATFDAISTNTNTIIKISLAFILIGIISTYLTPYVSTSLAFILYLIKLLKFIGAFLLLFSDYKSKYLWIGGVYILFSYEIISGGVFYDLFVWGFFLFMLVENKLKSSFPRKLIIIFCGFIIIYFIQSIKGEYRDIAWSGTSEKSNTEIFFDVALDNKKESHYLKDESSFNRFISRLNNGWILSKVMEHTPSKQPYTEGETLKNDLISVLLPRFLFPNKAITGGKENQRKFKKFTGRRLVGSTTMRIGALSDAYINFGPLGGIITMFLLGLLFNLILFFIIRVNKVINSFILWIPFIFSYAVRMSDIQVILNYTVKSIIFVILIHFLFFRKQRNLLNKS